ncbi:hypothetical protein LK07_19430 [Streptomyces pluripotens]|uniref:Uncharacterized protein n=1 Tax=Streptomyces pluripotens TaxID=1355015 RepID=A0A221P0Q6_9ACTN|nr:MULTISPECIES: hypothetical protein [Streptomyces]ARP71566.1 hypothetical protein LK06_018270 [Streptomyces pluripotens]ASN25817.1 hypothetical protein LK07_19430 [Streptomyces pluripotens]KIE25124.1 hypothetical protein LK08_21660 [Streptomyces sp. MUSC 125]MCH0557487.1 hypothetical protein [Streptomyces sp. MUM 16J]
MMKSVLAAAALAASATALAAPAAHADDHWTATGTARCAGDLAVVPVLKAVSPLPLDEAPPACGEGSLIRQDG